MGALIGYARVSTRGQARDGSSLESQREMLLAAGATQIFEDAYTGTSLNRPELERAIATLTDGDTLIVTKVDRLARSLAKGIELIDRLNNKGISVNVLNMGVIEQKTPMGKLISHVLFAIAEFERDMIFERTQEGRAIARKNKDYKEGRPQKYRTAQIEHALSLLKTNSYRQVVQLTGISKATLARYKKKYDTSC